MIKNSMRLIGKKISRYAHIFEKRPVFHFVSWSRHGQLHQLCHDLYV